MPIEIKELIIKAVIHQQTHRTEPQQNSLSQSQLKKIKKEITTDVVNKLKEYLKEQTER